MAVAAVTAAQPSGSRSAATAAASAVRVQRLLDRPIITPQLDASLGPNIQGPSLIRVPDWIANRLGTTPAGLEQMLGRIRMITLGESREWLDEPRPQLLAALARLQAELLEAGLLTAPTPFEPLLRWPSTLGLSSCRR